jgi:phosphopantothenoylcysteine synthetase/decarboxylase
VRGRTAGLELNVLVTCGPSFEPIDQARRITNFSTGRLGIALTNAMTDRGWRVICLKGENATCPDTVRAWRLESFSTNQDLANRIEALSRGEPIHAVLHAAALCDFRVARVRRDDGSVIESPKFPTREGRLNLELEPALKVLPLMRGWFPTARIVGWKYELAGGPDEALERAWGQLKKCRNDACVLNGAAYGPGFALCIAGGEVKRCDDAAGLARTLLEWIAASKK